MDTAADYLASLALAVECLIDPEAIFLGGRLPNRIIEGLMDRITQQLPARRISGKVTAPRYLLAKAGIDAAALGMATLPIYFFAPAPQVLLKQGQSQAPAGLSAPRVGGTPAVSSTG